MGRTAKTEELLDANGLTAAQEAYCRSLAAGLAPLDAVRGAEPGVSYQTARKRSKDYEELEKIKLRIQSLRDQVDQELIVNMADIKADLTRIATDEKRPDGVRLKAYDMIIRAEGGYDDRLTLNGDFSIQEKRDALSDLLDG